jgi:hypothetical protein
MSMHMIRGIQVHGKSKPKKKPGWQKAEAEHREWLLKHGIDPDVKVKRKREFVLLTSAKQEPYRRETPHYPSHASSSIPDAGTKKESLKYTGDYIIGIATMHKSNLVPVGRGDNPKDYATMRRN